MASGMDMLLKSFGVDPEQIKNAVEGMGKGVVQMNERLDRIEVAQQNILRILENGRNAEQQQIPGAVGNDAQKSGNGK